MTFNHKSFVLRCLDGILMQKSEFDFEVLIHDDASTDGTADLIRGYESKFPHIIKGYYQTENQFLKQNTLVNILFRDAKGKYIAYCEGDDYWTDPNKLQRQVDFLESNPTYSLVYHNVDTNRTKPYRFQKAHDFSFNLNDSLLNKQGPALSMVFKNFLKKEGLPFFFKYVVSGDWSLEIILLTIGQGYYMSDEMGFYRYHESGITKKSHFVRRANRAKWYFIARMIFWSPTHASSFIKFLYRNRKWARYRV